MQEGKVLFLDDATLISPAVLAVAYPAMDGRREITVKAHKGEVIKAADGFYVIAGHNPGVHGAILTEALSSRFSGPGQGRPPTTTSPTPSRSTPAPSRPPGTSPPGRPAARSAGHPSSANCSPTPRSPASSARTPPSPTWPASPPRKTRRRSRGRSQSLRPQDGRPPRPRPPDLAPARRSRKGPPAMSATATAPAAPAPAWLAAPAGDWKNPLRRHDRRGPRDRRPPGPGRLRPRGGPGQPRLLPARHPGHRGRRRPAGAPTPTTATPPSPPTASATRSPGAP